MKKTEFLALLRQKLYSLPPRDVEQTIEYYSEMIDDCIESGYPEETAVAKMGSVNDIARQILSGVQKPAFGAYGAQKQKNMNLEALQKILIN